VKGGVEAHCARQLKRELKPKPGIFLGTTRSSGAGGAWKGKGECAVKGKRPTDGEEVWAFWAFCRWGGGGGRGGLKGGNKLLLRKLKGKQARKEEGPEPRGGKGDSV